MNEPLDFFLFLGSTYTYLAVNRAHQAAAAHGVTLRWHPFSARSIMVEQNNRPFVGKPVKLAYMWRDVERRARQFGIPFVSIPNYPNDSDELANRVATLASIEGWCQEFAKAAYAEWFLENKDPGNPADLSDVLRRIGRNPELVISQANGQTVRARYAANTELARSRESSGHRPLRMGPRSFGGTTDSKTPLPGASLTESLRRAEPFHRGDVAKAASRPLAPAHCQTLGTRRSRTLRTMRASSCLPNNGSTRRTR